MPWSPRMTKTKIAHFTDTHLGQKLVTNSEIAGDKMRYDNAPKEHEDRLRLVLDDIAAKGISSVVFGGDIGTAESVQGFFALLTDYDFTVSVILGNHDDYTNVTQYWNASDNVVNGKLCFSRTDGALKHIFLDSSDNILGESQRAWLASELNGVSKALLFVHHPILAIDTPVDRAGAALRDRDETRSLLLGIGCEVSVFCGHYHMIDDASDANIRQFATPATSYQIVKQSDDLQADVGTFGYRILHIDGSEIGTEAVLLPRS
ncbi:metallophosphoesterase family protein [Rhizobium sp. A22-96]